MRNLADKQTAMRERPYRRNRGGRRWKPPTAQQQQQLVEQFQNAIAALRAQKAGGQ